MKQRAPARGGFPPHPFLYAVLDGALLGSRSLTEWVRLIAGEDRAAVVQWRFKGMTDAAALLGARELRAATRLAGVLLFINDRPDIARIVEADGVHVGQEDMDPGDVAKVLPGTLIGVSTHSRPQFQSALTTPVDYIAVGPVFGTTSKKEPGPLVGLEFVSWAASETARPLVAIGGLNVFNAAAVVGAGARGVAVISGLMSAAKPDDAARQLGVAIRESSQGRVKGPT